MEIPHTNRSEEIREISPQVASYLYTLEEAKVDCAAVLSFVGGNDESCHDYEQAHQVEDGMHVLFIQSIRDGMYSSLDEAQKIAGELMKVAEHDHTRWYK